MGSAAKPSQTTIDPLSKDMQPLRQILASLAVNRSHNPEQQAPSYAPGTPNVWDQLYKGDMAQSTRGPLQPANSIFSALIPMLAAWQKAQGPGAPPPNMPQSGGAPPQDTPNKFVPPPSNPQAPATGGVLIKGSPTLADPNTITPPTQTPQAPAAPENKIVPNIAEQLSTAIAKGGNSKTPTPQSTIDNLTMQAEEANKSPDQWLAWQIGNGVGIDNLHTLDLSQAPKIDGMAMSRGKTYFPGQEQAYYQDMIEGYGGAYKSSMDEINAKQNPTGSSIVQPAITPEILAAMQNGGR